MLPSRAPGPRRNFRRQDFPPEKNPSSTFPRRPGQPAGRQDFFPGGLQKINPSSTFLRPVGLASRPAGFSFRRPVSSHGPKVKEITLYSRRGRVGPGWPAPRQDFYFAAGKIKVLARHFLAGQASQQASRTFFRRPGKFPAKWLEIPAAEPASRPAGSFFRRPGKFPARWLEIWCPEKESCRFPSGKS